MRIHCTPPYPLYVSCITLCWCQRDHDQVRHHSSLCGRVCLSLFLVFVCRFLVRRNSTLVKGREVGTSLVTLQGAVLVVVGA